MEVIFSVCFLFLKAIFATVLVTWQEKLRGGQQILEPLEDPEKPWILFASGKMPWKTLVLHPTPENYVLKQIFRASIFGLAVLLHFFFL